MYVFFSYPSLYMSLCILISWLILGVKVAAMCSHSFACIKTLQTGSYEITIIEQRQVVERYFISLCGLFFFFLAVYCSWRYITGSMFACIDRSRHEKQSKQRKWRTSCSFADWADIWNIRCARSRGQWVNGSTHMFVDSQCIKKSERMAKKTVIGFSRLFRVGNNLKVTRNLPSERNEGELRQAYDRWRSVRPRWRVASKPWTQTMHISTR